MDEVQHPVRRPSVEMILNGSCELFGKNPHCKVINLGTRCNQGNHRRLNVTHRVGRFHFFGPIHNFLDPATAMLSQERYYLSVRSLEVHENALMCFFVLCDICRVPLSWNKTAGGDTVARVGFELLHSSSELGISQRRADWIIKWTTEIANSTNVNMSRYEEGLGRIVFVAGRSGESHHMSRSSYRISRTRLPNAATSLVHSTLLPSTSHPWWSRKRARIARVLEDGYRHSGRQDLYSIVSLVQSLDHGT